MDNPVYIAIFGDLHGHIALAIELAQLWERTNDRKLHTIYQVGDFGVWPKRKEVDRATERIVKTSPERMIFNRIINQKRRRSNLPDNLAEIVFIHGNHDNITFLDGLDRIKIPIPIDTNGKLKYLPDCQVYNNSLRVGALSKRNKDALKELRKIDVLLTHIPPYGLAREKRGSKKTRKLIEEIQPIYTFCGHYHLPGRELNPIYRSRVFLLNTLDYNRRNRLKPGAMAILTWYSRRKNDCEIVDQNWYNDHRG